MTRFDPNGSSPRDPNQHDGGSGRQPSNSDTNRRPAATIIHVAGSAQRTAFPSGAINFINVPFSEILPYYATLAQAQMDTDKLQPLPGVLISCQNTSPLTQAEAVQLFDKVFYDCGIVATHVDTNHVVFTYRAAERKKSRG